MIGGTPASTQGSKSNWPLQAETKMAALAAARATAPDPLITAIRRASLRHPRAQIHWESAAGTAALPIALYPYRVRARAAYARPQHSRRAGSWGISREND